MKKTTMRWMAAAVAAFATAAAAHGQTAEMAERFRAELLQAFPGQARAALAEAPVPADLPVAILPIHGDDDAWLAGQLKIALTEAGKNCVEGRDDPMWGAIIDELTWDTRKEAFLDPETMERFGRLQAAKVLVSGAVRLTALSERRWRGEVELHATELATKRHLWGRLFVYPEKKTPPQTIVEETVLPLNVGLDIKPGAGEGAAAVADDLEAWLQGRLVDLGYRMGTGKEDDLVLSMDVETELYDRTGEWERYRGEVKARLEVRGAASRTLGRGNFPASGTPGNGANGRRNLAFAMEDQLLPWLKRTMDPEVIGFSLAKLSFTLPGPVERGADFAEIEALRKTIEGLPGIRSVKLAGQDNAAGTVAYKVAYETEAFPGGLANALFAAHPELADKYLD